MKGNGRRMVMSEATSAIIYLLDILFKERNRNIRLKTDVSLRFRAVITEVEIYLYSIETEDDRVREKERNIAKMWSEVAAYCAPYHERYSDSFLKRSRCWSDPKKVPIADKMKHIVAIRKLLQDGRYEGLMELI